MVVAVDVREDEAVVDAFARELAITFPVGLDSDGTAQSDWGAYALPVHFWIDADGIVRVRRARRDRPRHHGRGPADDPARGDRHAVAPAPRRPRMPGPGSGRYPAIWVTASAASLTMSSSVFGNSPSTIVSTVATASPAHTSRPWASFGISVCGSRMNM